MFNKRKAEARHRLALSTAIIDNRHAVFRAVVDEPTTSLSARLAEFLLEEAGWSVEDFMKSYVDGELDD